MPAEREAEFMRRAIEWAQGCKPVQESVPRVGAIIVDSNGEVISHNRRGNGIEGDDEQAEKKALDDVEDKAKLVGATLYTTLEPCTPGVRTKEDQCCTKLILQHQITRVFVGILDPNQEVTGKGILELQKHDVEVVLFPGELAKEIRAINVAFIRSQESLGAKIVSPTNGQELATYKSQGKYLVKFSCLNPPSDTHHFLMIFREGLCWPQDSAFRKGEDGLWEIDAHFGAYDEHSLHIVKANELAQTLIRYYWKIVKENRERDKRVQTLLPETTDIALRNLLGDLYPGIQMSGPIKGLRTEDSVTVSIVRNPDSN